MNTVERERIYQTALRQQAASWLPAPRRCMTWGDAEPREFTPLLTERARNHALSSLVEGLAAKSDA